MNMMRSKTPADRHQLMLFNSLDEWISEDSMVRVIDLLVDKISASYPDKFIYLMKSRDGFIPACNVQTGTGAKHKMIVLAEVTSKYNDLGTERQSPKVERTTWN
jgi:hypothetical protein